VAGTWMSSGRGGNSVQILSSFVIENLAKRDFQRDTENPAIHGEIFYSANAPIDYEERKTSPFRAGMRSEWRVCVILS
jgi:hypothetical protein